MATSGQHKTDVLGPRNFLVIDHHADNGGLLVRILSRHFPSSVVQLCAETRTALAVGGREEFAAVVIHRTLDDDASTLTGRMRRLQPKAVIIVVSIVDRAEEVLSSGADGFLNAYDWLRLGSVVADALLDRGEEN